MARVKRRVNPFNLSFLDIMACGFGAVTLLFLLLKHDVTTVQTADPNLKAEVSLLQEDIRVGEEDLVSLRNSLAQMEKDIVQAQGLSSRVVERIDQTQRELSLQVDPKDEIAQLRRQVEQLQRETADLEQQGRDQDVRRFIGEGDRQYLTGLKLGGRRILILLDASASMLAEDIINVIRRRNMSDDVKRNAPKWQRALRTVEWLVAQLPPQSTFQLYTFNTRARASITNSEGEWQDTADATRLDEAVNGMKAVIPDGGTSLLNAFTAIKGFSQLPDNIFLITDGLPTQGKSRPGKNTVSGKSRANLFEEAVKVLPRVPVNVILFPMEGDPAAAALYWQLGLASGGSFLSPSKDWP